MVSAFLLSCLLFLSLSPPSHLCSRRRKPYGLHATTVGCLSDQHSGRRVSDGRSVSLRSP
ncbi:hypothetical protein Hanom_Chr06g00560971 [Helianthus anomalus]